MKPVYALPSASDSFSQQDLPSQRLATLKVKTTFKKKIPLKSCLAKHNRNSSLPKILTDT